MSLWNDLLHSSRALLREPGFTTVAILTVALGIGSNTAIFSVVNGVLLRPLPYRDPQRLAALREVLPAFARTYPTLPASAWHFTQWQRRATSFDGLAVIDPGSMILTGSGEPEHIESMRASAALFDVLRVQPALGRTFARGEDQQGRERVAVLTDNLWRRRFHADPAVIGQSVQLESQPFTVIGVLPRGFQFPSLRVLESGNINPGAPEVFVPLAFDKDELAELMGRFNYNVIARLKPGVGREQATAELNVIATQLVKESGEKIELRATVTPLLDSMVGGSRRGLLVLLGAVGSVLLILCVNLANLMLARAERQGRDSAIRIALGASRSRLLRQALMPALLIALGGGALGVLLAAGGIGAFVRNAPADIPRLGEVGLDARVLLFALAITTATGLVFGLAPAWRVARTDPQAALKAGSRTAAAPAGGSRLRSGLITAEVGLSTVLLVTAALLMGSFFRVLRAEKGFRAPAVLSAEVQVPWAKYKEREQRASFHERVLAQLGTQPGVLSSAVVTALPLQGETWIDNVSVPGDRRNSWEQPTANIRFISQDYFLTMGIPLRSGRTFSENDRKRDIAILSERLAATLWPGQDPLGRQVMDGGKPREVIGIVGDVRVEAHKPPVSMVYRPYWEWAPRRVLVVARAAGDPFSIGGALRAAVRSVDPDVPLTNIRTMRELLDESLAQRRFQMLLAAAFAATALLLASIGIYGVVSYVVTRRTSEIGVRIALGARTGSIYNLVLRQAMAPVVLGLAFGVAGALAAGTVLASLLYELSPRDPATIAAVVVLLSTVAIVASSLPARRATRVDPIAALRSE